MAHFRNTWESLFEVEVILIAFVGKFVEFCFVCFEMLDKVNEMTRLLKFFQVLSVNNVAKLILDLNYEFDCV